MRVNREALAKLKRTLALWNCQTRHAPQTVGIGKRWM